MKKFLIALVLLGVIFVPVAVFAQPSSRINDINQLANAISRAIWVIFTIVALVMFVIAGILFLTAAGNPEKIVQARNAFLWGVAGVVVGIIAFSIVSIIENLL